MSIWPLADRDNLRLMLSSLKLVRTLRGDLVQGPA